MSMQCTSYTDGHTPDRSILRFSEKLITPSIYIYIYISREALKNKENQRKEEKQDPSYLSKQEDITDTHILIPYTNFL